MCNLMSVFNIFTLLGGLAMFLYGMDVMGKSLEQTAGGKLQGILSKMTASPLRGLLLGLGLALGAVRDVCGLVLGRGRLRDFFCDVAAFACAAVLVCGFAAGASASGVPRWYMALGLLAGALAWRQAVSGALHRAARALADTVKDKTVTLKAKGGASGRLFGKITAKDVAEALSKVAGTEIDKRKVELERDIKDFGTYSATVKLHPGVSAPFKVKVEEQ